MKYLVCGSREWTDVTAMQMFLNFFSPNDTIISGMARGADTLSAWVATEQGAKIEEFPADWSTYGKRAGYLRNAQMLEKGKPDVVIAFGHGKGTDMMVGLAVKAGVPVYRIVRESSSEVLG